MQDPSLPQLALTILTVDFLRYALAAGAVWLLVEVVLRPSPGRPAHPRRHAPPGQVRREITYSLSTVLIFAANGLLIWLLSQQRHAADLCRRRLRTAGPGGALSLVLIIVAHDAWFYWTHRAAAPPALVPSRCTAGTMPRCTRRPGRPMPSTRSRRWCRPPSCRCSCCSCRCTAAVIGVFLVHMILRNTIGHCAHELFPWRWTPRGWLRWITPVSHHHFHHARNRGNYGLYFTWWDRWCGTEDAQYLRHGDERFAAARREASA